MDTPYALVSLDVTSSTQDVARDRFDGRPVLVAARSQTQGRGRGGSRWETAPRALAASLAFAPEWPADAWGPIPLVAGLAALESLPSGFALKWPNDVVREGEKVAGILVEVTGDVVVAGIGVNLWWPGAPPGYGAVFDGDPGPTAHLEFAGAWAAALLHRLSGPAGRWGRVEYLAACTTLGRRVTWQPDGEGWAEDIADDGALLVRTEDGKARLTAGRVSEIRAT